MQSRSFGKTRLTFTVIMTFAATLVFVASCGSEVTVEGQGRNGAFDGPKPAMVSPDDLTDECAACIEAVDDPTCKAASSACVDDAYCDQYVKCQKYCGWASVCEGACAVQYPDGLPLFEPLPQCFVCDHCRDVCNTWWIFGKYCD